MDSIRLLPEDKKAPKPCSRCDNNGHYWDRIAGRVYCHNCLEDIAAGMTHHIAEPSEPRKCAAKTSTCSFGTLRFFTYLLGTQTPIEIDLCGKHLRELISRDMVYAHHVLRTELAKFQIDIEQIFLLHGAFYDARKGPLLPVVLQWH
jgi:hypothetical protein